MELRGMTIELPQGIKAADVRALIKKRRDGGALTADEQSQLRRVFQSAGSQGSSSSSGPSTDYRFGGSFWVVLDNDSREIRQVQTGVTDLDRVEIVEGLDASDRVLILPSSHLVETQQDLQNFINRRMRGVPGIS